jgi:putative peptidoglycan lipid II flippase
LAWGVFIAGIAQLAFQIPFLIRAKGFPKFKLSGDQAGVKQVFTLMLPAIFGSSIVQINLLIDTMIASFLAEGSISWLYISDRFVELPLALFGIATATVILPLLSKQHVAQQSESFSHTMNWAIRLSLVIAIPAMMGLVALASPILSSLVQYREFTPFDTQMASLSLMAYALGLPAFIFIKILAPAFFSRQDTKTPVKIGVIAMLTNIVLNLLFVWLFVHYEITGSHAGLALATSLSAYVNAALLYIMLHRQRVITFMQSTFSLANKVFISAMIMFYILNKFLPEVEAWASWETDMRVGSLLGFIALGVVTYSWLLWALGIKPSHLKLESD